MILKALSAYTDAFVGILAFLNAYTVVYWMIPAVFCNVSGILERDTLFLYF